MRAADIEALVSVGRPSLAPDGSFVAFATSRPDVDADRAVGQLWRVDLPDGAPRRLTRGVSDSAPRVSRDGSRIAFLRADAKSRSQVFVVCAGGGEPVQATDAPVGVSEFSWAPDGRTIAFVARVPEPGRYGSVEGLRASAEPPRRITGIRWHSNGLGYTIDRPAHVFVVAAPDPGDEPRYEPAPRVTAPGHDRAGPPTLVEEARQLTAAPASWRGTTWSADGTELLVIPDVIEARRRDLRDRLVAVRVADTTTREVVSAEAGLTIDDVAVAADGSIYVTAAEVGPTGRDFVAPGTALWVVEPAGARRLTDAETIDLGEPGSHLTMDGAAVLVQNRTRGRVRLLRVSRDGAAAEVLGGDVEVTGHDAAAGIVVAAVGDPRSFGELVTIDGGDVRALTGFGSAAGESRITVPREIEAPTRDGGAVHGWVAVPDGAGPFPVILQIHGGPYAQFGVRLFDETQVLVDAGYAVVYGNPRGSAGYGRAHGRAIRQRMGSVDLADVIDLLEFATASEPRLDGTRVGVMGGSYGGYLTAWTIAHDHRFAAAIVERGFLDPVSFQGTSDIGSFFGDEYVGIDADRIAAQSPMAVVDRVRTPTLVIHSELDLRCPLEQATRYYAALRRQGTDAELLVFPGEDHELSRSGRPRHRVERFAAILDWWSRHLPIET